MFRIMGERTQYETTALPSDTIESILTVFFFEDCQYIFFGNSIFSSIVSATI